MKEISKLKQKALSFLDLSKAEIIFISLHKVSKIPKSFAWWEDHSLNEVRLSYCTDKISFLFLNEKFFQCSSDFYFMFRRFEIWHNFDFKILETLNTFELNIIHVIPILSSNFKNLIKLTNYKFYILSWRLCLPWPEKTKLFIIMSTANSEIKLLSSTVMWKTKLITTLCYLLQP